MKCRKIRKRLSAYQDGELGPEERIRVDAHLEACPPCRQWYADFNQVWAFLGELPDIETQPEFFDRLQTRISRPSRRRFIPWLREIFKFLPSPVTIAAMLLIGFGIGIYLADAILLSRPDFNRMTADYSPENVYVATFKAFDAIPPGSLARGYIKMIGHVEEAHR